MSHKISKGIRVMRKAAASNFLSVALKAAALCLFRFVVSTRRNVVGKAHVACEVVATNQQLKPVGDRNQSVRRPRRKD
jgi:hypothetical protein